MNALVLFDTKFGNTEQIARAVAQGLAPSFSVQVAKLETAGQIKREGIDLVVVGGPTHRHGTSDSLAAILEGLGRDNLSEIPFAAFDTRYHMAAWLTGSAAGRIARRLKKAGGRPIVPGESFFVERDAPPKGEKRRHEAERLENGELERAAAWGARIAELAH